MVRRVIREAPPPKITPEEFAESLPDNYLHCRVWGHHWVSTGHATQTGRNRAEQDAACQMCGTGKTVGIGVVRARARVLKNNYRHPADPPYLAKNVEVGLNREVFRYVWLQRDWAAEAEEAGAT
jgi:hypothetical protein